MNITYGVVTRQEHTEEGGISAYLLTVSAALSLAAPHVFCKGRFGLATYGMPATDRLRSASIFYHEVSSTVVAINGDLLNLEELTRELRDSQPGGDAAPHSASELAWRMYVKHGVDFVSRLDAIANIAIWHSEDGRLLLFPDSFGFRPFYYFDDGNTCVFASSIKAVLLHPAVSRAVDRDVLYELLELGFVLPPDTVFQGIKVIPPGRYLEVAGAPVARSWAARLNPPTTTFNEDCKATEYVDLLQKAVAARIGGAKRIAVLLSGGADSSAIIGMLMRLGDRPVESYTFHANSEDTEELLAARDVSRLFGTKHTEITGLGAEALESLPEILWHLEVPRVQVVAEVALCEAVDGRSDVVLSGDGNDIPWGLLSPKFLRESNKGLLELYLLLRRRLATDAAESLLRESRGAAAKLADKIMMFAPNTGNIFRDMISLDRMLFGAHFVNRTLGKFRIERQTLAHRFPYLDKTIIEFVTRLPEDAMVRRSGSGRILWKWLFKMAMERHGVLPARIIHRKKQWMCDPTSRWLRGERSMLLENIASGKGVRIAQYFDIASLRTLLGDHRERRSDNSHALETMLQFEVWHRIFFDSNWHSQPRTSLSEMFC